MPVIHNTINIGDLRVRSGSLIVNGPSSSIIIEPDNNITGSIRLGNDKVYTTGSNTNELISRRSIEPFWTNHDNQGQCSVINGGDLHSIDVNTKYGGIQSGYSSSLIQQCGSNIAGGIQNKIIPGIKGVVPANSILGGSGSTVRDSKYSSIGGGSSNLVDESQYSSILGGSNNCIEGLTGSFVIGTNISATASCTTFVNCLNIQNIDSSQPTDQLLVRNSTGLVRQGPSITDVSGSGTDTVIQVPGIVNPDRDVYVTGSNSVDAIATSSIQPFFMPNNTNYGACSVISSGEDNSILTGSNRSAIVSGENNTIEGGERNFIGAGRGNYIRGGRNNGIVSGLFNTVGRFLDFNFIGAGRYNQINFGDAEYSAIVGGEHNYVNFGDYNSVVGGYINNIVSPSAPCGSGNYNFIGGGYYSTLSGQASVIAGGFLHTLESSEYSNIGGGYRNCLEFADYSSIVGGDYNCIIGSVKASAVEYSAILGGKNNHITHCNTFIIGSDITSARSCTTFVNSFDVSGSLDMNLSEVPTSSIGLRQGQIYRTGSAFDELRIKL